MTIDTTKPETAPTPTPSRFWSVILALHLNPRG